MNDDILPSLLKEVQDKFEVAYGKSDIISSAFVKLKNKKATYATANDFALEVGDILAEALSLSVTGDKLPDGKMYYNIANRLLADTLGRNFELVSGYAGQVQKNLNKSAEIGLQVQVPEINQDRIDGLVNRLASEAFFYHLSSSSRYLTKNILCLVIQIRKLFSFGLKLRVKKSTRNEHLMLKIFDKVLQ